MVPCTLQKEPFRFSSTPVSTRINSECRLDERGIPHVLVIAAASGHYKIYSSKGAYITFLQKLFEVFFGGQELGKKTYLFMQPRNVRRMRRRRGTIIHSILILAEGADSANSVLTCITLWVYSTHKVQVIVSELIST